MNIFQYFFHDSGLSFGRSKLGNVVRKIMVGRSKLRRTLSCFIQKLFRYDNTVQKEATCDYSE